MDEPFIQPIANDFNIQNPKVLIFEQLENFIKKKPSDLEAYLNHLSTNDLTNLLTELSQQPDIIKKYLNRKYPHYFKSLNQQMAFLLRNSQEAIYMDGLELGSRTIKPILAWSMTLFSAVVAFVTTTLMALFIGLGASLGIALIAGLIELYVVKRKEAEFFTVRYLAAFRIEAIQTLNQKNYDFIQKQLTNILKIDLQQKAAEKCSLSEWIKQELLSHDLRDEKSRSNIEKEIDHLAGILEQFSQDDLEERYPIDSIKLKVDSSSYIEKAPLTFSEFLSEEAADKVIREAFLNEGLLRAAGIFTIAGFILTVANALGLMAAASFLSGPIGLAVLASLAIGVLLIVGFITMYNDFKDAQRAHENKLMGAEIHFFATLSLKLEEAKQCINNIEHLLKQGAAISHASGTSLLFSEVRDEEKQTVEDKEANPHIRGAISEHYKN